jgi:hypothetical protein
MGRESSPPRSARALAAYLSEHPMIWICGLPGGAFVGAVSRIDGDAVEVTAVAGGRKRYVVMPAGWNSRARKAPEHTRAIRDAFRFHAAGFRVSCVERRHPDEIIELHVQYIDECSPFS